MPSGEIAGAVMLVLLDLWGQDCLIGQRQQVHKWANCSALSAPNEATLQLLSKS